MDTVTLVDNKIDDGQRLLDRLGEEGFVVRAACGVKSVEDDRWMLYIATPVRDEKGPLEAYRPVVDALRSLGDAWLTGSDVTVVGEKHPIVRDVLEILRRSRGSIRMRYGGESFGGIPAEEVYIYSPRKVDVPIYGLVFRGEPSGLVYLSFEPHSPLIRFIVEDKGGRAVYHAQTGIDWVVAAPEGAELKRGETGLALDWNLHGKRKQSSAYEVMSLAKLGLHGFRVLREPDSNGSGHSPP
jgi:hypothetical protein